MKFNYTALFPSSTLGCFLAYTNHDCSLFSPLLKESLNHLGFDHIHSYHTLTAHAPFTHPSASCQQFKHVIIFIGLHLNFTPPEDKQSSVSIQQLIRISRRLNRLLKSHHPCIYLLTCKTQFLSLMRQIQDASLPTTIEGVLHFKK